MPRLRRYKHVAAEVVLISLDVRPVFGLLHTLVVGAGILFCSACGAYVQLSVDQ